MKTLNQLSQQPNWWDTFLSILPVATVSSLTRLLIAYGWNNLKVKAYATGAPSQISGYYLALTYSAGTITVGGVEWNLGTVAIYIKESSPGKVWCPKKNAEIEETSWSMYNCVTGEKKPAVSYLPWILGFIGIGGLVYFVTQKRK